MTQVTLHARDIKQLNSVTVTIATSCTVAQLKDAIANAGKWPRPGMRIAFRDSIADDNKTLESLAVTNNSVVGVYLQGIPMRMVEPNRPPAPAEPVRQKSTMLLDFARKQCSSQFQAFKKSFDDIYSDEEIAAAAIIQCFMRLGGATLLEDEKITPEGIENAEKMMSQKTMSQNGGTESFRMRWT